MDNRELIEFLREAKCHLRVENGRLSRRSNPSSFIFILDNVLEDGEVEFSKKGELNRPQASLEALFQEAGLIVAKKTAPTRLNKECRKAVIWALY